MAAKAENVILGKKSRILFGLGVLLGHADIGKFVNCCIVVCNGRRYKRF